MDTGYTKRHKDNTKKTAHTEIIERYCSRAGRNVVFERCHSAECEGEQGYRCLGAVNCECVGDCERADGMGSRS